MMNQVSEKTSHKNNPSSNLIYKPPTEIDAMQSMAFIPYNKKWGVSKMLGSVQTMISADQKCIIKLNSATSYLGQAILKCVNEDEVNNYKARYVTFDVEYSEGYGCYVIDQNSFQIYYGSISQLGKLQQIGVFIEVTNFISPSGQVWIDEKHYEEYANGISAIYECSDGTLVRTYADFKTWEKELALRPNNPNYQVLPYNTTLTDIEHFEVDSDGTIWRNKELLQEYLSWRSDHNHNYQDGYYCGAYGVANSFKEYAKIYNTCYFVMNGLRREEQYMDPTYNLLFSSQEAADAYIKRLKSFQKKI